MMQDSRTGQNTPITNDEQDKTALSAHDTNDQPLSEQDELNAVTDTLADLLQYLSKGEELPETLLRRADALWTMLDRQPPTGNEPIAYPLEGEGNLLRKILYAIEHGEQLDLDTLQRADAWVEQIRGSSWATRGTATPASDDAPEDAAHAQRSL